jgi:hypothetical protein
VAKSRADVLQAKGLQLLGHILDFAALRIRLSDRFHDEAHGHNLRLTA